MEFQALLEADGLGEEFATIMGLTSGNSRNNRVELEVQLG
jgi:hypothetical protein